MSLYLHNLIVQGEHQRLDFKYEISDAKKIARTFSAFANSQGGTLLIGVKDNGNIVGVRTDEEEYMAEAAAHVYCKPRVEYKIRHHKINEKTVLEVMIPESKKKPHRAPWKDDSLKAFVRVFDQNFLADTVLLEAWRIRHHNKKLLVRYDKQEQALFQLLRERPQITLHDYLVTCQMKRRVAINIFAQLILIKAIDYRITEKETFYFLPSDKH